MQRRLFTIVVALALLACIPGAGAASLPARSFPDSSSLSLAFQEISAFATSPNSGSSGDAPILSDDGTTIAYTNAPGTGDEATPNRIFVINADGSNPHQVDSYKTLCYCTSVIDISADGSAVVSTDSVQIRIADGGGSRELITMASNEINALRISGDGSHVFFRVYRDTETMPGGEPISRGLWTIDPDGSNLRQVVSPAQMVAIGLPPTDFFGSNGPALDSSTDGSRIVFGAYNDPKDAGFGQGIFGVNLDGSGLHDFSGRVAFINSGAISSDGSMVAWVSIDATTNVASVGVAPFAGGAPQTLFDDTIRRSVALNSFPDSGERLQLNEDGSTLLLGSSGVFADTGTGALIAMGVAINSMPPGVAQLVGDGLYRASMTADASRLLYLSADATNVLQLVIVEVNPDAADMPVDLAISDATVDPASLELEGASSTTVTATVAGSEPPIAVGAGFLRDGLSDPNISAQPLYDDGTHGDATAGDAAYTNDGFRTDCCAAAGPRTVRVQAQGQESGHRIAVAVEIGGISVGGDAAAATPTS